MNFTLMTHRKLAIIGFFVIICLLVAASYLQVVVGLDPCPLCIFQRICFSLLGLLSLLFAIHNPKGMMCRIYQVLMFFTSLVGTGIAARHVWLQHLPKELVPPCGASLDVLLKDYPLWDVIRIGLKGSGDCALVTWRFLSLSLAEWSLIWFVLFDVFCLYLFRKSRKSTSDIH